MSLAEITHTTPTDYASKTFLTSIYAYMVGGLLLSTLAGYITLTNESVLMLFSNPVFYFGIIAAEIGLALGTQFLIHKTNAVTGLALFALYSVLNGMTLSLLFLVYAASSALSVLVMATALFAALALIGHFELVDIRGWGGFLSLTTFVIVIAAVVNIFLQNSVFNTIISMISMVVFSLLTIYDARFYKDLESQVTDVETRNQFITLGALHMYMNFVVLFTSLLNLFGSRD